MYGFVQREKKKVKRRMYHSKMKVNELFERNMYERMEIGFCFGRK